MEKIKGALDLYEKTFKTTFPTIPLVFSHSDEEIIKMVNECIKAKKDVYDMGYLTLDTDIIY